MMKPRLSGMVRVALAASFLVGCGLLSSDIATISFDLSTKQYTFATADWGLPSTTATLPDFPCQTVDDCCVPASAIGFDCTKLTCNASSCGVSYPVDAPPQPINLRMEVPELSSLNGQTLANISISKISYSVNNTLGVTLPPVELFLAPEGATTTSDSRAKKFGTVPAIAPGSSSGNVALEPDAEATFTGYARYFATPFTFLARTTVSINAGDPFPSGMVTIAVTGRLKAKPNL